MTKALVMIPDFKLSLAARLYLTYQGFDVTLVTSLAAAKTILKEALFDLVMLDLERPTLETFQVIRHLRREGFLTPVLYLSDRKNFKTNRDGIDDFVEKPLTSESLRSGLNRILTKAQSHEKPFLYGGIVLD